MINKLEPLIEKFNKMNDINKNMHLIYKENNFEFISVDIHILLNIINDNENYSFPITKKSY